MTITNLAATTLKGMLCAVIVALSACASTPPAADPAGGESDAGSTEQPSGEEPSGGRGGPGSFDLRDPAVGLDALETYGATLHVTFNGTQAGEPVQWDRTYTFAQNNARLMSIDAAGEAESGTILGEVGAMSYRYQPDAACLTSELAEGEQGVWEPASALPPVIGADEAGAEEVDGVAAARYTFDQGATTYSSEVSASGEVWIAEAGGYVLRYILTVEGPLGDGVEGAMTWDYTLDPDALASIELPADCPLPLDAPLMADASAITQGPGLITYTTQSTQEEVIAFYQDELAALGWTPTGESVVIEGASSLWLTQGDQSFMVVARAYEDGHTKVILSAGETVAAP